MPFAYATDRHRLAKAIVPGLPSWVTRDSGSPLQADSHGKKRSPGDGDEVQSGLPGPRDAVAILAVLAGTVLVVLNAAIANIALPTIARSLQVVPAMSVWVATAYQVALLMALLPCAALGESVGYRRIFTGGVAVFTGASMLCALAPSLFWLVAARFLQGLGGAAVMALGIALLRMVVPQQQLGSAIGWNALAVALSSAAGPMMGAAILSGASWPWIFAVNLPLGVLVLFLARALPQVSGTARRLDLFSVALNAGAFAALIAGAELFLARPATAATLLTVAAIAMAKLVRRELPKEAPLMPLDLLHADDFRLSAIASVLFFAGVTAGLIALPFYLQNGLGQDAWMTGLYMTPWPLTVAIAATVAGRLADRTSTAWPRALGCMCLATGLGGAALWPLEGNPLPLVPLTMLCGLGFGLFNVANNRRMLMSAPVGRSGAAGGMQGTARLFGQTAGAVLMTMLFTLTTSDTGPLIGLGIGAVLTLLAGLVSMRRLKHMAGNKPELSSS